MAREYTADKDMVLEKEFTLSNAESLDKAVSWELVELPVPQNASAGEFCAYGSDIFYVVEYIDYVAPHTGVMVAEGPMEQYATQICRYSQDTGEVSCVYTAAGIYPVWGLRHNGERLFWAERNYENGEVWEIKSALQEDSFKTVDTLLKSSQAEGSFWDIIFSVVGNSLFFYNYQEEAEHPIVLYEFDLGAGELKEFRTELDSKSGYQRVVSRENRLTTYYFGEQDNKIYVDNLETGKNDVILTTVEVCNPKANENYCIWTEGYDVYQRYKLYFLNFSTGQFGYVKTEKPIFSFELIGHFVFISESGAAIWCLDMETEEMTPLIQGEEYSYIALGIQNDNTIYTKLANYGDSFILLKISVN